ncbi:hypothetical protein GJ496_002350 [Pomphorhynchus laevis]|nr:hypothetical protein GJ496_002350 [Pomphorhynchus laevis]
MPYITSTGQVLETRPWSLSRLQDIGNQIVEVVQMYFRTLFDFEGIYDSGFQPSERASTQRSNASTNFSGGRRLGEINNNKKSNVCPPMGG